jgi:hypothetical protein
MGRDWLNGDQKPLPKRDCPKDSKRAALVLPEFNTCAPCENRARAASKQGTISSTRDKHTYRA